MNDYNQDEKSQTFDNITNVLFLDNSKLSQVHYKNHFPYSWF